MIVRRTVCTRITTRRLCITTRICLDTVGSLVRDRIGYALGVVLVLYAALVTRNTVTVKATITTILTDLSS